MIYESSPDMAVVDIFKNGEYRCIVKDIKEKNPSLPILVVSSVGESLYAQRCLRKGASGFITLENHENEILKAVRTVLEGEVFLSEEELQKVMSYSRKRLNPLEDPVNRLSEREFEVYTLAGQGLSTKEIAHNMGISHKTVDTYYSKIRRKLNINNIVELRIAAFSLLSQKAI
jgi:DNA-binding NarL/FixJ family response regulator